VVKLDILQLDVRKLKKKRKRRKSRCFGDVITVMKEHLQQNMDVEFMNVHVRRNKLKLSTNLQRNQETVINVDVQDIILLNAMRDLM
jgi:hypothetical protein